MSTITKVICDIHNCTEEAFHKQKTLSVRFMTEQNEGRSTTPYLSGEKMDMCEEHYQQYIDSLTLVAYGAQGYNEISFTKEKSNE